MLDKETEELIRTPRCGVEDVLEEELVDNQEILEVGGEEKDTYFPVERRRKRYALQGSRWRTKSLTYKIGKYASAISRSEVTASCPIQNTVVQSIELQRTRGWLQESPE